MIKYVTIFALAVFTFGMTNNVSAELFERDITNEIPEIWDPEIPNDPDFKKFPDRAQYKEADWSNVIGIARGISISKAFEIAKSNPEITFFFYTKGSQMVLEKKDGTYRVFQQGDTVFFSGEPWFETAPGLADGYIKL
jgi:hypothetical protein